MVVSSYLPFFAIIISTVLAFFIYFSRQNPNLREFWTILASIIKFLIIVSMIPVILSGKTIECSLFSVFPGLDLSFRVDGLGIFFAITASFLWILTSFYSIGYVRSLKEHAQTRYFICFAISLSSTIGVAFSANLFTMYIFYEILTLSTYPLVGHEETKEALRGAKIYLVYLLGTSIAFLLPAIIATYIFTGSLEFTNGGIFYEFWQQSDSNVLISILFVLFILGITKSAIMPLHSWLPNAMVAPTPVSALLHAVAVVKTGVFVVIRVVLDIFGIEVLSATGLGIYLAYFASITIIVASIVALRQDNIKARLAYSTISQLSYIIVGVSLLTPAAIKGSILHIIIHAFSKITLFFWAGAILVGYGKKYVSELSGVGRKMPFSMAAFTLGALSLIGLPPFAGLVSKMFFLTGAYQAGQIPIMVIYAASSFLNAAYFIPIIYIAYFKDLPEGTSPAFKEAPALMLTPMIITAIGTIILFFVPYLLLQLLKYGV